MIRTLSIAVAAFGLFVTLACPANAAAVIGIGVSTCSTYLSDIRDPSDGYTEELMYYSWAEGWMSDLNVGRQSNGLTYISGNLSATGLSPGDEQESWLQSYCASHPSNHFYNAASALYMRILSALGPPTS